jgi:peptide-methionine (R)-S-oxide reductase
MGIIAVAGAWMAGCGGEREAGLRQGQGTSTQSDVTETKEGSAMGEKVVKTDAEWKKELTSEQYEVMREKGTERPFSGKYWNTKDEGEYQCAGCGLVLFKSEGKFDSGCGWPSFDAPAAGVRLTTAEDTSFGMERTEVMCPRCGSHMGHVFHDGPTATGLRYCINSASLKFDPVEKKEDVGKK